MKKNIITLTESELTNLIKRVIKEQGTNTECIKGNCENGSGTYKFPSGSVYVGQFKDGQINGQGTFKWADGSVYVGQFKDSKLNGQGTFTNLNGVKSSGNWADDKLNGKSLKDLDKLTQSNQTKTECIDGDCENGQGTYKFPSGAVYEGQWKDDKFNGQGTYKWLDGAAYEGEWKDGKKNGQGTYTNLNGVESSGIWADGKLGGKSLDDLDKITQSNTACVQPTEPTHSYKDDKNYQYAKSGDCWWAKNINNNKWFNLTELVKTKPNIKNSIDRLNDGTNLIEL